MLFTNGQRQVSCYLNRLIVHFCTYNLNKIKIKIWIGLDQWKVPFTVLWPYEYSYQPIRTYTWHIYYTGTFFTLLQFTDAYKKGILALPIQIRS